MTWWYSKDERGEQLMTAHEAYKALMENLGFGVREATKDLIESIEKFLIS
jgi:hypothetical protein